MIDVEGNLRALTTRTDLKKNKANPCASKDKNGKLLVGAAVKAGSYDEIDMERVHALSDAGCNIIVLDGMYRELSYYSIAPPSFSNLTFFHIYFCGQQEMETVTYRSPT